MTVSLEELSIFTGEGVILSHGCRRGLDPLT
jgi:hypothetical protein